MKHQTQRVSSFPPLGDQHARVLILGSMPGEASLKASQYYAHPRNSFWPIMGDLLEFDPLGSYHERVDRIVLAGVAVWDVLKTCERPGSADADIDDRSSVVNDFRSFFELHPRIHSIFFNGSKAEACFRKLVTGQSDHTLFEFARLPSTSPAHASLTFRQKLESWKVIRIALAKDQ